MARKDVAQLAQYVHPDIKFTAPLANFSGKDTLLESARAYVNSFESLNIRESFSNEEQVMLVKDVRCHAPIGKLTAAVLMTFKEGLISEIELLFDARPFC